MKTILRLITVFCILLLAVTPAGWQAGAMPAAPAATGTTELISVASDGSQGDIRSGTNGLSISADGRYVAFASWASNLVSGDANGVMDDVFVRDLMAGTTERVSESSQEIQGNGFSYSPIISADGQFVAFMSYSNNLVEGDTNGLTDVFVRDRAAGTTERVSVASDEGQGNNLSNGPTISADGRYVAFNSQASNLVNGDTNSGYDVFIRDRLAGITERISVASDESQGNADSYIQSISADGRYVAFVSYANNLVDGDTNGFTDIFVRDWVAGTTERVSLASDEIQGNGGSYDPAISANGRYVAFESWSDNLVNGDTNGYVDIFVRDRVAGTTERVSVVSDGSQGDFWSEFPSISADGQYVVFQSGASNLVGGDTNGFQDVFIHDRLTQTTERISVSTVRSQGNEMSQNASISADGRYVAFSSYASNLVIGDTNDDEDVFLQDRLEEINMICLPFVVR